MNKIESALRSAIETIENYGNCLSAIGVLIDTRQSAKAVEQCKSALSDIEKCEPVGIVEEVAISHDDRHIFNATGMVNVGDKLYTSPQPIEKCEPANPHDYAYLVEEAIQRSVSNSPQPLRDLGVYLSELLDEDQWSTAEQYLLKAAITSPQLRDCEDWQYFDKEYKKAAETSDATDWMNAALLAQQVRRKQLNTKG